MRGGTRRENVAQTLDEISEYSQIREETESKAAALEAKAQELLKQANKIRKGF